VTPPQVDPEVFLLELKGRYLVAKRTEHACRMALECFHRAIDRDPSYAAPYVGLADSFSMLWNYGMIAPAEAQRLVLAAIDRAAALRADPADIHRLKAFVHWQFHPHDWLAAIEEYERALTAAPGAAILWQWSGVLMGVLGRPEAARERLRRAAELDPLSLLIPAVEGWTTCYFARRFEAAIPYYRRVLEMDPESVPALWYLGEALTELGRHEEALAAFEKALRVSERMARLLGYYGYACGRAGRTDLARAALNELEQRARRTYVPAYFPALIHAGLEDVSAALRELERSYSERDSMLRDLKVDPPWDRLRSEPRFRALMDEMKYP
jgi:tetratricopeptide (TPR) repeat protein